MWYLIAKALLSGAIIAIVSEVAQKLPAFGALIASLPLVSILAMIWLYKDTQNIEKIASHSSATFWFVLPSLPMFLVFPALLRGGVAFFPAMALSCAMTVVLYLLMIWGLKQFGITL